MTHFAIPRAARRISPWALGVPTLLCFGALLLIAGCSDKPSKSGQVAAKVNGEEITVHQINQMLQRLPGLTEQAIPKARQEVTQRLIDAELLRQQAVKAKLDRNPDVVQSIESARTDILANAYLQSITSRQQPPSDADISKFYREHPELFRDRKVFRLSEITLPGRPAWFGELNTFLNTATSVDQARSFIVGKGVQPSTGVAVRSSDQFPMEVLPLLSKLKAHEFATYGSGGNTVVAWIESITPAPLNEASAKPLITVFLTQQRRSDQVRQELERLRASAKIENLVAAADPKGAADPKAAAKAPAAPNKAAVPAAAPATAPAAAGQESTDRAAIERGVKGLR